MGCASSAPLVQGGLGKAKQAAAEAEKIKEDALDKMKVILHFSQTPRQPISREESWMLSAIAFNNAGSLTYTSIGDLEEGTKYRIESMTKVTSSFGPTIIAVITDPYGTIYKIYLPKRYVSIADEEINSYKKDTGESMKEKVIELKEEVEEKMEELVGSGRESAEEAAKAAAEAAQKEVEEAGKKAVEEVEVARKEAEERVEEVTEEAKTAIEEAAKEEEKQDSRASTAGLEGFPSADLEEIRDELDEDEGGVERLEAARLDLAEEEEEAREAAAEAANDRELEEILAVEEEAVEEGESRIQVGTEAEDAHGQTQPPDPEENNNSKNTHQSDSNHTVETA